MTHEVAIQLARASRQLGRRLGLLIDRNGGVFCVCLGDAHHISIPDITFDRVSPTRLRGLRFVHTHLSQATLDRRDLLDLARFRLDLTLQLEVDDEGEPVSYALAHLLPPSADGSPGLPYRQEEPRAIHALPGDFLSFIHALEEEYTRRVESLEAVAEGEERALLVGVHTSDSRREAESRMAELEKLARSAGASVCGATLQRRPAHDPRYLVGPGKLDEILLNSLQHDATVLIFDRDLTPAQAKNISRRTDLKILDRSQLILEIFARRARAADGKIQVELARLQYMMPRLVGESRNLGRIRGGIDGNRGVGEQKLELDRRRLRRRIHTLQKALGRVGTRRAENRKARNRSGVPVVSLVGYTNAGKSTWMRALSRSEVEIGDQLFATLDTTSRRLALPGGARCLLTDSVGFLRDLPPDLVAAFRATLDDLHSAHLLVHVADASDPAVFEHIAAVRRILADLDLLDRPRLLVFNKADRVDEGAMTPLVAQEPQALLLSALRDPDRAVLLEAIEARLQETSARPGRRSRARGRIPG